MWKIELHRDSELDILEFKFYYYYDFELVLIWTETIFNAEWNYNFI